MVSQLIVNIAANIADMVSGVNETKKHIASLEGTINRASRNISSAWDMMGRIFVTGTVAQGIRQLVTSTADAGEEMLRLSKTLSMPVESISALKYASEQMDVSFDSMTTSIGILSKNLLSADEDSGKAAKAIKALGINIKDTQGNLRPMEDLLIDLSERFSNMRDGAEKTALSMLIFGRSGKDMLAMLDAGPETIRKNIEEAKRLGIVWSEESAKAADEFNDNIRRLESSLKGLVYSIGNTVIPALNDLFDAFSRTQTSSKLYGRLAELDQEIGSMQSLRGWFEEHGLGSLVNKDNKILNARIKERQEILDKLWDMQIPKAKKDTFVPDFTGLNKDKVKQSAKAIEDEFARMTSDMFKEWEKFLDMKNKLSMTDLEYEIWKLEQEYEETRRVLGDIAEIREVYNQAQLKKIQEWATRNANAIKDAYAILEAEFMPQTADPAKTFNEGLQEGIDDYLKSLEWGFDRGKDMAREAAQAMNDFFEDVFTGRIKVTWKNLMGWMGGLFAQLVAEMTTKLVLMTGVVENLGAKLAKTLNASSMQSLLGGTGLGALAGGLVGGGGIGALVGGGIGGLASHATIGALGMSSTAIGGGLSAISSAIGIGLSTLVPVIGGIIGAGLGKLIGDLVSSGHSPNLQLGTMGTPNQAWTNQFGEGDFTLRKWNEIGSKNTQQILKVFDTLKESMKSFMTDMNMDLSKLDETWKSTMADADSNIKKVINRWVGEYASFLTGIDFKSFQRSGEEMADTVSRVISAIGGMKMLGENIDLVIQYLDNSTDSFAQFRIGLNELDKQIQDTKNNMATLTDPSEIFDAANELYSLTMQKYEAEVKFVQELEQSIKDLQIEFAQFTSSIVRKIAGLGGGTGGLDDAINMIAQSGRELAQQLMSPNLSLGEKLPIFKNFMSFLDEWYSLNFDKIEIVGEAQLEIYDKEIEKLEEQLSLVEDWHDVLKDTREMIFDLKATTASPRDAFERLAYVRGEIGRTQGLFRTSTGEEQIKYARELQSLINEYGKLAQDTYQRPSNEYQAIYNDMISWLQEIEAVSAEGAKSTEDLLKDISYYNERIKEVNEQMAKDIDELNKEAVSYYRMAKDMGSTIYSGQISAMQSALQAIIGDKTVGEYIEYLKGELVGPNGLQGVKDYLNAILYNMTGYDALANQGVPSYQHGTNYVPQTGLAYLHKGEQVIPAGESGINLTLSPTIYANGDATPREIWRELEDYAIQSVRGGRLRKALQEK